MTGKVFQQLFLEAIDEAFSSLGESAKQAIYFHLDSKFNMTREQIPRHLEDFEEGLEKIFGEGTKFLEIMIMKKLYALVQSRGDPLELESQEFKFVDYVKAAEKAFGKAK